MHGVLVEQKQGIPSPGQDKVGSGHLPEVAEISRGVHGGPRRLLRSAAVLPRVRLFILRSAESGRVIPFGGGPCGRRGRFGQPPPERRKG